MREPVDADRYIRYLWGRRLWIGLSSATAVLIALAVSLCLVPEYTATVRLVIEPPAGTDLRAAMAVSPIYLESLRTYEQFASSDSLFADALRRFALRRLYSPRPIESLKKHILRVQILRNTRILEISTTLPDPGKAHALAQFLAESTVALNRSLARAGDGDLVAGFESQQRELRAALDRIETEWTQVLENEPTDNLKAAMEQDERLRAGLEYQRLSAETEAAAEASAVPGAQERLKEIRRQMDQVARRSSEREKILSRRQARRDRLESERKAAQAALATIEARLRETRGDAGYRGERIRIIDPGIVPERPSSPNLPLNVAAALLLGVMLPLLFFAIEMHFRPEHLETIRELRSFAAVDE